MAENSKVGRGTQKQAKRSAVFFRYVTKQIALLLPSFTLQLPQHHIYQRGCSSLTASWFCFLTSNNKYFQFVVVYRINSLLYYTIFKMCRFLVYVGPEVLVSSVVIGKLHFISIPL